MNNQDYEICKERLTHLSKDIINRNLVSTKKENNIQLIYGLTNYLIWFDIHRIKGYHHDDLERRLRSFWQSISKSQSSNTSKYWTPQQWTRYWRNMINEVDWGKWKYKENEVKWSTIVTDAWLFIYFVLYSAKSEFASFAKNNSTFLQEIDATLFQIIQSKIITIVPQPDDYNCPVCYGKSPCSNTSLDSIPLMTFLLSFK
jgi:hypothetical protein